MARSTIIRARNNTGSTITANTAVYITGYDDSVEEDPIPTIGISSNNNANTMPSIGLVGGDIEAGDIGTVRTNGLIAGLDTAGQSFNDPVFIGTNGNITFTDPVSTTTVSQKIGVVSKVGADIDDGEVFLFPIEIKEQIRHDDLLDVFPDQHHDENHAYRHVSGGEDELNHNSLPGLEEDTHPQYLLADGTRDLDGDLNVTGVLTANNGTVSAGTSFPLSPTDGQKFYRTDLTWQFTYDASRGKWLGEIEWDGAGNGSPLVAGGSTYLRRFNGVLMSSTVGIWIPYDITIVGVSMVWINPVSPPGSSLINFKRNGVTIGTHGFNGGTSTDDLTLDINFASGGILGFEITVGGIGGTNDIDETQLRCWFRRRAT